MRCQKLFRSLKTDGPGTSLVVQWLRIHLAGFPSGAVVGSLPANSGDAGSSPGLGRSHMPQSGWAREPQLLSLRVWSCAPQQEGPRW